MIQRVQQQNSHQRSHCKYNDQYNYNYNSVVYTGKCFSE